ncbi:N-formylglutamate amidohydrolase [Sphingomonas metalli]|uniref:N-formylglutamate amidohydrolase n=1 Tax=Sphingomonas metalli TaxID=1779358 RepID=A0A916SXU4_9SPHN|nr:N-formylglutamate amidohydrolase [Sphingomonas metalli]GGB21186.1 N-formylglutamate amidohydrolase [Sphingomonas metalli]
MTVPRECSCATYVRGGADFQSKPARIRPTLIRVEQPETLERLGAAVPASPVVVSVPHAGRLYPDALLAALAVPEAALRPLEDRHVDAVARAAWRGETMLIQRHARAWIDLNRSERERDPRIDVGAIPGHMHHSARVRSGLGLVPRRASGNQTLWRGRFAAADIAARIAAAHRPYHMAVEAALAAARARFGTAVLLDLHSMPPLGEDGARMVIGDRFGRTAAPRFVARAEAALAGGGCAPAINLPYAGGHIVERHGRPARRIHALQLEIDRSLYLDAALDRPGAGLAPTAALVRDVIDALADEALASALPMAAE